MCMQTDENILQPYNNTIPATSIIFSRCDNSTKEGSDCASEEIIDDYINGAEFTF